MKPQSTAVKARISLVSVLSLLFSLIVPMVMAPAAQAVGSFNNAVIADYALSHYAVGSDGGQCRTFVNVVVKAATGVNTGTGWPDYFAGFTNAGAQRISNVGDLQRGDIVQIGQTEADPSLHTFIIVGKVSGSTFDVIDSNHNRDGKVDHYYRSVTLSDSIRAYRLGVASGSAGATGNGTLYFIKTKNSTSGRVEIHSATPASGYQTGMHATTWFGVGDQDNGWFQMVGADLVFIKTRNTGSGRVEIHTATAASGYQSGGHYASAFGVGDAGNGWFQMAGGDLIFIKTRNTGSGRVEFFRASAGSGFGQVTVATATAFSPGDAGNGWFQVQGADLVFIKTRNTGSGRVEFFRAPSNRGYTTVTVATATAFSPGDQSNGWFSTEDVNSDGNADLIFIKTRNTGSGRVEFFVADGSRSYQAVTSGSVTWLSPADADNGWFLADSKQ